MALAAIAGQESNQLIHRPVVGRIMNEATLALAANQPDPAQVRQMEGQRGWCHAQLFADGAGVDPVRAGFDQQAENGQAGFMPQGSEKFGGV